MNSRDPGSGVCPKRSCFVGSFLEKLEDGNVPNTKLYMEVESGACLIKSETCFEYNSGPGVAIFIYYRDSCGKDSIGKVPFISSAR